MFDLDFLGRCLVVAFCSILLTSALVADATVLGSYFSGDELSTGQLAGLIQSAAVMALLLLMFAFTLLRPRSPTRSNWANRLTAIAGTFMYLILVFLPVTPAPIWVKLAGGILAFIGTALSIVCLSWLGRSFSLDAQARRLVTGGPYAIVRHPLYVAEAFTLIGLALANSSVVAFAVVGLNLAVQLRRAINEERVLRVAFPDYANYAAKVPRLVPFSRPLGGVMNGSAGTSRRPNCPEKTQ
ncbi:MAG TPA: isoprenylcysteine carboxylmethyltransferase family protein [Devosiaceae bacterium]|nr:isoprenylcysteine carboxylmethyltransferase family protein [Devosiaceae bacterium]